jgi:hypothetical protein
VKNTRVQVNEKSQKVSHETPRNTPNTNISFN